MGGGAFAVAGGVLYGIANGTAGKMRSGEVTGPDEMERLRRAGSEQQSLGFLALGAGAGALATSGAMLVLGTGWSNHRSSAIVPAAGGAACLIAASVFYGLATATAGRLRTLDGIDGPLAMSQVRATGENQQAIGFGLLGVGIGALGAAAVMFLGAGEAPAPVSVAPVAGGAMMVFHGALR